jgi:hypothetical protein
VRGANRAYFGGLIILSLVVPILYAELQVLGRQVPCAQVTFSFRQAVDLWGRPSSTVRIELLKVRLTGEPVGWGIWEELKFDAFRRVSGWVLYFDAEGRMAKRYAFYNAALVELRFYHDEKGLASRQAATHLELHFSPATVDVDGQRLEAHSVIPWETDVHTSFRALTKPSGPLPSAHLAALLGPVKSKTAERETAQPQQGIPPASKVAPQVLLTQPTQLPPMTSALSSAPLPTRPAPKMRTGAEAGLPATPDSIRTGEVAMEQHPDYPALVQHLAQRGYPLVVQAEAPHVFFKRVCDKQGSLVREEKYVAVVAGMRFLDLEHEAGHVGQLEDRFGGNLPIRRFVQLRPDREVEIETVPDVLKGWQDNVTEYHNRLVEYQRLTDRGASPELLAKHLAGLSDASTLYFASLGPRSTYKLRMKWTQTYFPDLQALIAQAPIHF